MKMGTVGCLETSVTNYQCTVRNNPEERRSRVVMILETQREPNQNLAAAGQDSEFLLTADGRSRWVVCVMYRRCPSVLTLITAG